MNGVNGPSSIIVRKEILPNNSKLNLKVLFVNLELQAKTKQKYYKILIWVAGQKVLHNFDFKLFLKVKNAEQEIPIEGLASEFYPSENHYLTAKIPSNIWNQTMDQLTYTFVHDNVFAGQGQIICNLMNNSNYLLDNQLIYYDGVQSNNLILRALDWQEPRFYFNHHYQRLLALRITTINLAKNLTTVAILDAANLILADTWSEPVAIQALKLSVDSTNKSYQFKPVLELQALNNNYEIKCQNYLELNANKQVVESGIEPGLYFNPWVSKQWLTLDLLIYNQEKSITFTIPEPHLWLRDNLEGVWLET